MGPIFLFIATVVSSLLGYVLRAYLARSILTAINLVPKPLQDQIASAVLMGVVVYITRRVWYIQRINSIVVVILGAIVYFLTLITISAPLRQTIRGIMKDAGMYPHI